MTSTNAASKKILSAKPSPIEEQVAKAILELEITAKDLSAELRDLSISSVKARAARACVRFAHALHCRRLMLVASLRWSSLCLSACTSASRRSRGTVSCVPRACSYGCACSRLIRELEKKFSNKHVTFVAQRTILSKNVSDQHTQSMQLSFCCYAVRAQVARPGSPAQPHPDHRP